MNYFNFLSIIILLLLSCSSLVGKPGISETIEESKRKGVFICKYESDNDSIFANDSLKILIDVAWLERKWAYSGSINEIIMISGYQLIIRTVNEIDDDYAFTWTIGLSFDRNFRTCNSNCLVTDFDVLPKEVEKWEIQQGRDLYTGSSHRIIGRLDLIKSK